MRCPPPSACCGSRGWAAAKASASSASNGSSASPGGLAPVGLARAARSSDWLWVCWRNQSDPLGFVADREVEFLASSRGRTFVGVEGRLLEIDGDTFRRLPMVLETPKGEDLAEDRRNLGRLRALVAGGSSPRSRATSVAATILRLAASRSVAILPSS